MLVNRIAGDWTLLGAVSPSSLGDARMQAHWAMQVVGAIGRTQIPPMPDDSHSAAEWLDRLQAIVGGSVAGGYRVGLRVRDLRLLLLRHDGTELASVTLEGQTLEGALKWLKTAIRKHTGGPPHHPIELPDYDMPAHAVADGGAFKPDTAALNELATWYSNMDRVLQHLAAREKEASAVRCWPHQFDLATLLSLDPYAALDDARTIGVGFSPGDSMLREPYLYVTPWPNPDARSLPALAAGGVWRRGDWVGAVLSGGKVTSLPSSDRQVEAVCGFLESALVACRQLLKR